MYKRQRLLDHRLHPGRPALRHQRAVEGADSQGPRPGHQGLLRRHHQPHRRHPRQPAGAVRLPQHRRVPRAGRRRQPRRRDRARRRWSGLAEADQGLVPLQPGVPQALRRHRQDPGLAQRPRALPQPGRLHLRRRVRHRGRLLRPRRPRHPEPQGGQGLREGLPAVGRGGRRRRLPDRHRQARQHGLLAAVGARAQGVRRQARQQEVLHVRRGLLRRPGRHRALRHQGQAPGHPRLPVPGRRPRLRLPGRPGPRPGRALRPGPPLHHRRHRRLRAADLPRQPRHGPFRLLPARRQPRRRRGHLAEEGPARQRADVPHPGPARRLLRRRAGLHRRRRRQGRPPGRLRLADPLLQRRPRPRRQPRLRRPLRPGRRALPGHRRPGEAPPRPPGARRRRPDRAVRGRRPRRLRLLPDRRRPAGRVPGRGQQRHRGEDRHPGHLLGRTGLRPGLPGPGRAAHQRRRPQGHRHRPRAVLGRAQGRREARAGRRRARDHPGGARRGFHRHRHRRRAGARRRFRPGHLRGADRRPALAGARQLRHRCVRLRRPEALCRDPGPRGRRPRHARPLQGRGPGRRRPAALHDRRLQHRHPGPEARPQRRRPPVRRRPLPAQERRLRRLEPLRLGRPRRRGGHPVARRARLHRPGRLRRLRLCEAQAGRLGPRPRRREGRRQGRRRRSAPRPRHHR